MALTTARRRLDGFRAEPVRHAAHAAKVLLKFHLLERQRLGLEEVRRWARLTPYFAIVHRRYFAQQPFDQWFLDLLESLCRSGALERRDGEILNR